MVNCLCLFSEVCDRAGLNIGYFALEAIQENYIVGQGGGKFRLNLKN